MSTPAVSTPDSAAPGIPPRGIPADVDRVLHNPSRPVVTTEAERELTFNNVVSRAESLAPYRDLAYDEMPPDVRRVYDHISEYLWREHWVAKGWMPFEGSVRPRRVSVSRSARPPEALDLVPVGSDAAATRGDLVRLDPEKRDYQFWRRGLAKWHEAGWIDAEERDTPNGPTWYYWRDSVVGD